MSNKLIISPAPHIHSGDSIEKNMRGVIIALLPALLAGFYFFGLGAVIVTLVSVGSCVLFEYFIQRFLLKTKPTISDGSAVITGLLLAMNLPSNIPFWIVMLGALFAIGVAKMSFGGLGNNPFNPALAGRVFLLISFPVAMTSWPEPSPLAATYLDAQTGATMLSSLKGSGASIPEIYDLLIGDKAGSLGEVSALAILVGLIYLLVKKIISWHIPVSILLTVAIFTGILHWSNPEEFASPIIHLLGGGLLLGAVFMATDYATSPMNPRGMLIFGVGIGIITVVIREFGAYPEGVSFAILIMNAFTPLINTYVKPRRFS